MRVRCSHCGAEYEAAVTRAGLGYVARCQRCGRTTLCAADDDEPAARRADEGAARRAASEPDS